MQNTDQKQTKARMFTGLQPTGSSLHIGNYFGAIRQNIALQHSEEAYYFIVNYQNCSIHWLPSKIPGSRC